MQAVVRTAVMQRMCEIFLIRKYAASREERAANPKYSDAIIGIKKAEDIFCVKYNDPYVGAKFEFTIKSVPELIEYLDLCFQTAEVDEDTTAPFDVVQFQVKPFPDFVLPIEKAANNSELLNRLFTMFDTIYTTERAKEYAEVFEG